MKELDYEVGIDGLVCPRGGNRAAAVGVPNVVTLENVESQKLFKPAFGIALLAPPTKPADPSNHLIINSMAHMVHVSVVDLY